MSVTAIYDMNKKKVGEMELPDDVFGVKVNPGILHEMVIVQLQNKRQGNASTKTRSEVRGGGRKPYKQKGTGRARHGSSRSPIFVGGGITFGPQPRNWKVELPKKQKAVAFKMALSMKNKDGNLFVVSDFASTDGKTKSMAKVFEKWETKSGIVVTHGRDDKTYRAVRNIPNIKFVQDKNLNVLDLVKYEHLLVTKDAVGNIVNRANK